MTKEAFLATDRRQNRKEIKLLSNESAWLQKALFALQKADDAREELADSKGEDAPDFILDLDGKKLAVEQFEEAMENRIKTLLDEVRERRKIML
jgi:hypothetical protein